jgi:hypothetical protein
MAPHITSPARKVNREEEAADISLQLPLPGFLWNVKDAIETAAIPPLPSPLP